MREAGRYLRREYPGGPRYRNRATLGEDALANLAASHFPWILPFLPVSCSTPFLRVPFGSEHHILHSFIQSFSRVLAAPLIGIAVD